MKMKVLAFLLVIMLTLPLALAEDANDTNSLTEVAEDIVPVLISEDINDDTEMADTNMPEETEEEVDKEIEEEAINEETEEETVIMKNNLGKKVRIMQLQYTTLKSYLVGEEVISILSEKGEDTTTLEAINAEIQILRDEANALKEDSEATVEDFVAIKRDLISKRQEFKTETKEKLTEEERAQVFAAVNGNEELALLKMQTRNTIREHNKKRAEEFIERMNGKKEEILSKIESGELNTNKLKNELKERFSELPEEAKEGIRQASANKIEAQERAKEAIRNKTRENFLKVQRNRLQERLQKLPEEHREQRQEKIQKEIQNMREKLEDLNRPLNRQPVNGGRQ